MIDKKIKQNMRVLKMIILRWKSGGTKEDKVWNKYGKDSISVASIVDMMRKNKLRWFGHVIKREDPFNSKSFDILPFITLVIVY